MPPPVSSFMSPKLAAVVLVAVLVALTAVEPSHLAGQEWSRFRGPNGAGTSDAQFPALWSSGDYAWTSTLEGEGQSSPVVWGERIFLTSAAEGGAARLVICTSASNGKPLWTKRFAATPHPLHRQNSFASSTPAVDESRVYLAWATSDALIVTALDHDGNQKWQANLGPFTSQHGFGTSPIVYEDSVIIGNDQDGASSLIALDRATGNVRWRVPRRTSMVAYSTPCVYSPASGKSELIFHSPAHGISAVDPQSGKTNWELDVFNQRSVGSPVIVGNIILGACGSGGGARNYVVAVRADKKPEVAYRIEKSMPYVPTPIAHGELVFLWGDAGIVTCIEAEHGTKVWQKRIGGTFSGSPVCAGDRLYCISTDGEVVVLAASRSYELLGRVALGEASRSTPAIAGGRMLLRTASHLFCLPAEKQAK